MSGEDALAQRGGWLRQFLVYASAVAAGFAVAAGQGMFRFYSWMTYFPDTTQLPALIAAWLMSSVAAGALLFAGPGARISGAGRWRSTWHRSRDRCCHRRSDRSHGHLPRG
ncbi:hypothetical protein BVC93_11395 [Mycobacterium sp. MS1601]|uniref:hypothetical protein n=1 Tax=Mycobacterium sp. MS1601 TaxID=1936029 RepID=UPI0009798514|nr:hypothetical protein [Mycobacterium sp. MS1601]AQA02938.1 hypothetical protein BVC93_11395 [Mycobacterium sp. MS1601]